MNKNQQNDSYVALLYFHGIGQPNRHEEISRLSDGLSNYAMSSDPASIGELRAFKTNFEPMRGNESVTVSYLSFNRFVKYKGSWRSRPQNYRLYEGFWSPTTAGGMSPWVVMIWFLMHVINLIQLPFRTWRESRRLKLISLFKLAEKLETSKERSYCRELAEHYRHFDKRDARLDFSNGNLAEFKEFLARKYNSNQLEFANSIVRRWSCQYRRDLTKLCGQYIMVAVSPLTLVGVGVWLAVEAILSMAGATSLIMSSLMLVGVFWLGRLYKTYVADIFFWVNQQEKNSAFAKKSAILDESIALLRHVMSDEKCTKVVIVAHSLGTSIAFESLIELGKRPDLQIRRKCDFEFVREQSTELDLSKLSHYITLGSPIDKIASIFEITRTDYHRYNDFIDETKGNVTLSPFTISGSRNIEWTNYWDPADPVSGPIYSKRYNILKTDEVFNNRIHTSSSFSPFQRHSAYLENVDVMKKIFGAFILRG